ncbi:PPE domain-containing protein [Gordonia hankookensis]|uniref:PPE domain-containing protein n=1 Tax=Gordonia hankookensis TaxID=589403 RepID=A0ABR7W7X0_9ACTN|nr:PPE domain-containing protein [Gordonia hankookensis]MBD1318705.1 PPE domain-containing protein [Gordonia hankookensis]NDZ94225.1 PPE domain-containing protein [Streptomyces sp. SID11726]NEB25125.1 PPE domain-containing protein [Streptomyces sp. SID6673]
MTGFTGVIWDARPTEKLAFDLGDGPGPGPLTDAGLAWGTVSAELASAATEYGSILAALGLNWRSPHTSAAFEKLTRLAPWFAETAAAAGRNAGRAEGQAAAVTVARLTMPNIVEVDVAEKAMHAATVVSALAPALVGAAAHAERALHDQKLRAARVMETYEAATESAARPWTDSRPAPDLVSAGPLGAERAARQAAARAATHPAPSTVSAPVSMGGIPMGGVAPPPEKTGYAPTILAGGAGGGTPVPAATTPSGSPASNTPMGPMATHPAAAATERAVARGPMVSEQTDDSHGPSASAADERSSSTWAELAVAEQPAAHHVSDAGARSLDPRYLTETLSLDQRRGG